jgi:hypothetical protein
MKEHRERADFDVIKWGPAGPKIDGKIGKFSSASEKVEKAKSFFFNRSFQEQS